MKWHRYSVQKFIINFMLVFIVLLTEKFTQTFGDCDWICDNGSCIDSAYLCDGTPDCTDSSDEIAINCIHFPCPSYAYRCVYGGCVSGSAKCNGVTECADGSDELPIVCEKDSAVLQAKIRGRCGSSEMQCKSGECINVNAMCDGQINCPDGSDETVEFCANFFCPAFAFRCGYGGCVNGYSKCNGTEECPDGTDEAPLLCNRPRNPSNKTIATNRPSTTQLPPTSATIKTPTGNTCTIPRISPNLLIKNIINQILLEGDNVRPDGVIKFECQNEHKRVGNKQTYCAKNRWNDEFPLCEKICSESFLFGISTTATCRNENYENVACRNIRPGTSAYIGCATSFQKYADTTNLENTLTCTNAGKWDKPRLACRMNCGDVEPIIELAKGGKRVSNMETPWHVDIYLNEGAGYKRRCGGSIISPKLVITAAHCFQASASLKFYELESFLIIAGNHDEVYTESNKPEGIQENFVVKIEGIQDYDALDNFVNDFVIAIMKEAFKFSYTVRPVCPKIANKADAYVRSNIQGSIVGWGPIDNDSANVLQRVQMKSLSHADCIEELEKRSISYTMPNDKFCITRSQSTGDVCQGDSGGGFIVKKNNKHYLVGIVSNAPTRANCATGGLVMMTNVAYFSSQIETFMLEYEDKGSRDY